MAEGASAHGPRALGAPRFRGPALYLVLFFRRVAGRRKGPQKLQGQKSKITLLEKARPQK